MAKQTELAEKKAEELMDKFRPHVHLWDCHNDAPVEENHAKQCAIICCREIISMIQRGKFSNMYSHMEDEDDMCESSSTESFNYWQEVKQILTDKY